MRSTVVFNSLSTRQRRIVAILLTVVAQPGLLVTCRQAGIGPPLARAIHLDATQTPTNPSENVPISVELG